MSAANSLSQQSPHPLLYIDISTLCQINLYRLNMYLLLYVSYILCSSTLGGTCSFPPKVTIFVNKKEKDSFSRIEILQSQGSSHPFPIRHFLLSSLLEPLLAVSGQFIAGPLGGRHTVSQSQSHRQTIWSFQLTSHACLFDCRRKPQGERAKSTQVQGLESNP